MNISMYQIDAFTNRTFGGNPAAVCVLYEWPEDTLMQSIAVENNLSETSFMIDRGEYWDLRWFTPHSEIDLAGHPTLAAAWTLFEILQPGRKDVRFETQRAGSLTVTRSGTRLSMDFPSRPARPIATPALLTEAPGIEPVETLLSRDLMAVFPDAGTVASLKPDFATLARISEGMGVIVTAAGGERADFVSRFFVPKEGIDEDPVTGSAHCTLIPYWAGRLGKTSMFARQISARGGELYLESRGNRVVIAGECAFYMEGRITL